MQLAVRRFGTGVLPAVGGKDQVLAVRRPRWHAVTSRRLAGAGQGTHLVAFEIEQAELGRLLVVPTEAEEAALEPYLLPIQIAGIEAEGEYLAYLESLRPKEREPTIQERMAAWHRAIYTPAVTPAKKAFGAYLSARQKKDPRGMSRACREISSTVSVLLRSKEAFDSPDPRLAEPLRRIYVAMRQMSKECSAGRAREIEARFTELQAKLQDAGKQMARYRLRP